MITIQESGMNFGPFEEKDLCWIEKTDLYNHLKEDVRMVEFIVKQNKKMIFLEAKSSSPKQLQMPVEIEKFNKEKNIMEKTTVVYPSPYIAELCNKINNALHLLFSANLRCVEDKNNEILDFVDLSNFKRYKIKFYLVINGHEAAWIHPIQDILQKQLLPQMKIWNMEVKVLNDEMAREAKLIS